jgi:integrase
VPLWPETVAAVREALAARPEPENPDHAGPLFVTKYGKPWAKDSSANPVSAEFRKIVTALKLHRRGLGFYTLRHVFETVAGD